MKINNQKGVIPAIILVALALSAVLGGFIGFQLGDGSLMGFGIGFGIVFFAVVFFGPHIEKLLDLKDRIRKR